jgi:hypothetical protein
LLTHLAEPNSALYRLSPASATTSPVFAEPQYDPTTRFAGYDVFLSHSSADKDAVEAVARRLEDEAGLRPFLDKWHLIPGNPWQEELDQALDSSRTCAVFIGPHEIDPWENEEMRVALMDQVKRPGFRVIPVLLPGAMLPHRGRLPRFLTSLTWVDFRAGLDDAEAFHRLVSGIKGQAPGAATSETTVEQGSPYRGLEPFSEMDAPFFFGRESLVEEMLELVRVNNFLVVIGPSGSGKSSAVQAGLIPRLRQGAVPFSQEWRYVILRPGAHPLDALSGALASLLGTSSDGRQELQRTLAENHRAMLLVTDMLGVGPSGSRLVLVLDQFEEIWSLSLDPKQRMQFIQLIVTAATAPDSPLLIVLTIRADFYSNAIEYRPLADLISAHSLIVPQMTSDELRRAIELPARQVGLAFEPGLIDTILNDVAGEPGTLPLLQFLLRGLWEERHRGFLTNEAYYAIGGVQGALAMRAERVFSQLTQSQQAAARHVLLRLIQLGEDIPYTRRRASLAELLPASGNTADIQATVNELTNARLLVTSRIVEDDQISVELTHEVLLRSWPRLRQWIDEERESLYIHFRLSKAAAEWEQSSRDESFLYRGLRLAAAEEFRQSHVTELNIRVV